MERTSFGTTDDGNAQRLVHHHGEQLRFVVDKGKWIVWDGRRWAVDSGDRIVQFAREVARSIVSEANIVKSSYEADAIRKHGQRSLSKSRLDAMIQLAASDPNITVRSQSLDDNDMLLNVANGTIDLRTGSIRPHSPKDLLTKITDVPFHAEARCPEWEEFILTSCSGNSELAAFLQRVAGYLLTGSTEEEVLFFLHGPGATGKSTFLEVIQCILGEYSTVADFDTFVSRRNGGPRHDVARLAGARLVSSVEVNRGERLAEGLIKQVTGGDTVAARHLYSESFEYRPRFKLLLVANDRPRVEHDDSGMWRRIVEIPFVRVVPAGVRDNSLKHRLRTAAVNESGILAWAVAGCARWMSERLNVPAVASRASEEYRSEMDVVAEFLDEVCVRAAEARVGTVDIHAAFREWLSRHGRTTYITKTAFFGELDRKGFSRIRSMGKDFFGGVRLRAEAAPTRRISAVSNNGPTLIHETELSDFRRIA